MKHTIMENLLMNSMVQTSSILTQLTYCVKEHFVVDIPDAPEKIILLVRGIYMISIYRIGKGL